MRAREIKFRIWDNRKKIMIKWEEAIEHPHLGDVFKGHLKDYVLMQATGLKDVQGNEIFEGDIVKYGSDSIAVIIWNEFVGCWMISYKNIFDGFASDYLHKYKVLIIGNLAQNQDLLP